ncbi:hypothetical protein Hanom_Chr16g01466661 [Helianthus anomalus]
MTADTISRLAKGPEPRVKRMICRINNPAYVALENDAWRHDNSNSKNENEKISEMVEKKTRWWFIRDGKRKRTPKTSPVVPIPTEPTSKIVLKGHSKEPQQRLVDERVLDPSEVIQKGTDLLKQSLESYLKKNEEVAAQKDQSTSVPTESVKETEPEGVGQDNSSEADDESTETETKLDLTTLGRGKAQLKKKGPDEEYSTYIPSVEETQRMRIKRKVVQTAVIPRNVRAIKGGATLPKDQGGKKEKHVETSKVLEVEKDPKVEIPKEPEVQSVEIPEVGIQQKADEDVEITRVRASTPPPPPPPENLDIPESSQPKKTVLPDMFEGFPNVSGEYKGDLVIGDDFDMFNNAAVKALEKKVSELEKEKAKAEAKRDVLKKQVEELMKTNDEIKTVMIKKEKKIKKLKDGVHDNTQLFELLSAENVEMEEKMKKLQEVNQTLNGLLSDLHEATSNNMKAMKLEMEAMKANKVMKDEQLTMLYTVMEHHLGIDVHSVFNSIEINKAEERRVERERRLAEEATQRKKSVIVETQEAGGSSSQADIEMVDVEDVQAQGFVLVGESSSSLNYNDIIRRVLVEQRRRKAKEPENLLLKWKEGEMVVEEEEKEDEGIDFWMDEIDNYDPANDKDDDDDQGTSGLLIVNPSIQQKIEDFLNNEINEQEKDHQ